jgi:hypothetical protein
MGESMRSTPLFFSEIGFYDNKRLIKTYLKVFLLLSPMVMAFFVPAAIADSTVAITHL